MKQDKRRSPETRPDKALLVFVNPRAGFLGRGNQFKVHANDHVIAVTTWGTYAIAELDPGEYLLVSQRINATGFRINLEAGKDYYFFQNSMGSSGEMTLLTRHTKELALHEIAGSDYATWSVK